MRIEKTGDGSHTVFSETFQTQYHSIHGSIQESQHVFIQSGLKNYGFQSKPIKIFEMGLGTYLNPWLSSIYAQEQNQEIHYFAMELYPLRVEFLDNLNYPEFHPEYKNLFSKLIQTKNETLSKIHPLFFFQWQQQDFLNFVPAQKFDLIFYDAFGPGTQLDLWSESICLKLYSMLEDKGMLTTFCAQGQFKRNLKSAGFKIESIPGPPGKKEMTRALKE